MKKQQFVLLVIVGVIILFAGYIIYKEITKPEIKDIEAYCISFGEMCPQDSQNKNLCGICGTTKVSSYASCHSKEFCKNTGTSK